VVNLLFYVLALVAVLAAIGVLTTRNTVMSVCSLLVSFFAMALIYLLAGFQFMAAIQILVYAGAIMVLFLFVVMLLNLGDPQATDDEPLFHRGGTPSILAVGVAGGLLLVTAVAILRTDFGTVAALPQEGLDPASGLAEQMFTRYALPFEAASVLLLATTVGVMVLAKRNRPGSRNAENATGGDA